MLAVLLREIHENYARNDGYKLCEKLFYYNLSKPIFESGPDPMFLPANIKSAVLVDIMLYPKQLHDTFQIFGGRSALGVSLVLSRNPANAFY